jgi:hypothetical protein
MKEEKGKFEETVRSKLYGFESNIDKDNWDRIAAKLPAGKTVKLLPLKRYSAVAAAVAALMILAGGLFYFNARRYADMNVQMYEGSKAQMHEWTKVQTGEGAKVQRREEVKARIYEGANRQRHEDAKVQTHENTKAIIPHSTLPTLHDQLSTLHAQLPALHAQLSTLHAPRLKREKSTHRRWGFGMGGGRFGVSSATDGFSGDVYGPMFDALPSYPRTGQITNNESGFYGDMNSIDSKDIPYTTDVRHRTPLSFGLGASYYLNGRWTLQSGLVYTMLRSDWSISNVAHETYNYMQRLHYLGIPLSVSYRLGEWKKLRFYASAGGMFEYNIAGNLKITTVNEKENIPGKPLRIKMQEPLFSVNTKAGAVYPVWRFVSIYAETGASYYFDNGSYLKTVRSDKPLNLSMQLGISFGI